MGGATKCLMELGGHTLLRRVINRAESQCSGMIINANTDFDLISGYDLPLVKDTIDGFVGPRI